MYLLTLVSPMSMPSLRSSPWIRGAPQSGFSRLIFRISLRTSFDTGGRPRWPRRTFQVQNSRNPLRCQAMTVPGLTMQRAERQSAQAPQNQATRTGRIDSVSASSPNVAARQVSGGEPGSQAAMPLECGRQTVWTQAMPISRRSTGIDGECATPTVSGRSEFARTTVPATLSLSSTDLKPAAFSDGVLPKPPAGTAPASRLP